MRRVAVLAMVLGVTSASAWAGDPPPVILDIGPVVPTPVPTPNEAMRRRLITTLTVQNVPGGDTVVNFEAMDFADSSDKKFGTIASARYSLSEELPKVKILRTRILEQIRVLEHDLLDYAEAAGPPKERGGQLQMAPGP